MYSISRLESFRNTSKLHCIINVLVRQTDLKSYQLPVSSILAIPMAPAKLAVVDWSLERYAKVLTSVSVNVTLLGKWLFEDVIKVRSSRGAHPGLTQWSLIQKLSL